MSSYWPAGLDVADTSSPLEMLATAQKDWEVESGGVVQLVIQETESKDGDTLLIVHAKHVPTNRTTTLFSIVHRAGDPYPVRIQPPSDEVPDFLRKSYERTEVGPATFAAVLGTQTHVTNRWVSDTPSEFRSQLEEAFNLGVVKAKVLNLVSATGQIGDGKTCESTE